MPAAAADAVDWAGHNASSRAIGPGRQADRLARRYSELAGSHSTKPNPSKHATDTAEASEGSILDDGDIVYVVRVPGPAMMTISVNVGARRPAYATAMGRVLLAHLPEDELNLYLDTHELKPILSPTITSPVEFRAELARVRDDGFALVSAVQAAARDIELELKHSPN
jgi:DNA-binding IclR family transcriptional regulator